MPSDPARPVLLDGGLASELEAAGRVLDTGLWSAALLLKAPEAIVVAHRAYLDAGAGIVISASYQASRAGFEALGVDAGEADRLIASSVGLARRACSEYARAHAGQPARRVAASVGPYGAMRHDGSEYTGDYGAGADDLRRFHAPRLEVLDRAGADFLAVETIPSLAEARVLSDLLRECATPAWVSFSCRNDDSISDGTPVATVAAAFAGHPRVFALGVNCTAPRHVTPLLRKLRQAIPGKALVAYPNSGELWDAAAKRWTGSADTKRFVRAAEEWFAAGATYIGGCCRIGPAHIAALRARWPEST